MKTFFPILFLCLSLFACTSRTFWDFSTDYLKIRIDSKGYITSMRNITIEPQREFSPPEKPSPLMCLFDDLEQVIYKPESALYDEQSNTITLKYANKSVAEIRLDKKDKYFKFTLVSLSSREHVHEVQWGSYHTNISNLFGEIIGVARDTSEAVNYAIGVLALNDITTGGLANTPGGAAPFQYIIHTPDPESIPLPSHLHEGQLFPIGGDGISDVAFYAHHEPYYRILYGNSATIDSLGRVSVNYHSVDRTKEKVVSFSLIPFLETNVPNHIEVAALPGVDFIGSSIALWGSPDSTALLDVVEEIVLAEGLPHPTIDGKWVKDPARYIPDVSTSGRMYDSTVSYTRQLGFKAVHANDYPGYFKADRGNKGYIDGKEFENKQFYFSTGNKSHKEFADILSEEGLMFGRHTIGTSLAQGTKDASPVPSDSLCYQLRRILAKDISPTDTLIEVKDPLYLDEIGSWEGHCESLNMIKIGKELIHYLGVSETAPYYLQNVTRGYWGSEASAHSAKDTLYKLQVTINYGYDGIIPNMVLQDLIAEHYAEVAHINGLNFMDLDGQEFLFNQGHGYYSVKRFFRSMFDKAEELGIPYLRVTGATLSEGSWHYQSIWNVGGGKNMYDVEARQWGTTTSEGKDLRDVAYANYFPATFGINFGLGPNSTVADYEHVQAISVGVGATYMLLLNQKNIESCPQKNEIFKAIKTWEDARAANAFPGKLKKELAKPEKNWTLERGTSGDTWVLHELVNGQSVGSYDLKRSNGY